MTDDAVELALTHDEALVLFELLARFDRSEMLEIVHPAEEQALWNLGCLLEKTLTAPFDPRYAELLAEARARLRPGASESGPTTR